MAVETLTAEGERCLRVTKSRGNSDIPAPVSTRKSNLLDPTLAATLSSGRPCAAFTVCRGSFPYRDVPEPGWGLGTGQTSYFYLATYTRDGTCEHQVHRRGGHDTL